MTKPDLVRFGADRSGERLIVEGVVPLDRKVRPGEVGDRFFIYEHRDVGQGGPPRHLHHDQEDWIYVLAGEIVIEVGGERATLHAGDSALAPRGVPHAWANLSGAPASLIVLVQPAGSMEAFFRSLNGRSDIPDDEMKKLYRENGMELTGPPLT